MAPLTRVRVARATSVDVDVLARLMARSPLLRRYGVSLGRSRAALRTALAQKDIVLVARAADGDAIGLAWVIRTRALAEAAYLRLLLVADRAQGHGVGRLLLARAEAAAVAARARHMCMLVTRSNHAARRFYERLGYRRIGVMPDLVRPGIDECLYAKIPIRTLPLGARRRLAVSRRPEAAPR